MSEEQKKARELFYAVEEAGHDACSNELVSSSPDYWRRMAGELRELATELEELAGGRTWNKEAPTQPGWYWAQVEGEKWPLVLRVYHFNDELQIGLHGSDAPEVIDWTDVRWWGPEVPSPPTDRTWDAAAGGKRD